MANVQRRSLAAFSAACATLFLFGLPTQAADGPNRVSASDVSAGQFVDSLLGPDAPKKRQKTRPAARRKSTVRGKLAKNQKTENGLPLFALVDTQGKILRYVEPVKSVDLEAYLGKMVSVRRDTGKTLLASQLALPRTTKAAVQLAQHHEPIPAGVPILADEPFSGEAIPSDSSVVVDGYENGVDSYENGPIYLDGEYNENEYDEGLHFGGGCPNCGSGTCSSRRGGGCGYGARGVMYAHAEYLMWYMEGMNVPRLVIQFQDLNVGTGDAIGPFTTLYGGNRVLEDERHGGRLTLGLWLDDYGQWGLEGDYLRLSTLDERFVAGSKDGLVPPLGSFIGRPFFQTGIINGNLLSRGPSQEDVDTNRLDGTVTVDVRSEFQTAGIRLRHNLCCREGCNTGCGDAVGCGSGCGGGIGCGSSVGYGSDTFFQSGPLGRICRLLRKGTRHTDVLYGFRWANLDESIQITEDLQEFTSITTNPPTLGNSIDVFDRFATENEFMGGEIGYETEWEHQRWSLNFLSKLAIGNTRQRVRVTGSTTIDDGLGTVSVTDGGLLTQRFVHPGADLIAGNADDFVVGNIGDYKRDEFSMIPEIGLTLGYNLTQRLKLTGGYTLLYWSNVLRPGDQIDLDVNGNLLNRNGTPDPATIVQGDHPRFVFHQTDLWLHGLNLGAEYTW